MTTIVALVSAGLGIALVPASMRQLAAGGVVYRPLTGTQEEAAVMLAYRRDERAPAVLSLIRLASALVAEDEERPREMVRRG
jgi:DNA-binding transcriptional LysR family regulator